MSIHELLFQDQHYKDTTKCVGLVQIGIKRQSFTHSPFWFFNEEPK
jgi:hypothetical protein